MIELVKEFSKNTLISAVLHFGLIAIIVLVVLPVIPERIPVLYFLDESFIGTESDTEYRGELAREFLKEIGILFSIVMSVSLFFSLVWLSLSCFYLKNILGPGRAVARRKVWLLFAFLGFVIIIIFSSFYIDNYIDTFRQDYIVHLHIIFSIIYLVFFYLFGSLFVTPKILRPAVPLASRW